MADGRKGEGLSAACGLSVQVCCVGQEACWRSVVCRGEKGEWVKEIVGGVWSVGVKTASGSRGLSAGVVWRGEKGEWVKRPVGGVWSVGAKMLRGSKDLAAECGLSGRKGRVGQRNCRQSLVCRGEKGEWVKRIVGGVWSVGAKRASGSKGLSLECGLSA